MHYLLAWALADLVMAVEAQRMAPACFLVEVSPWMDPAWLQHLYLDVVGLELVVVALFLLAEWDQVVEGGPW